MNEARLIVYFSPSVCDGTEKHHMDSVTVCQTWSRQPSKDIVCVHSVVANEGTLSFELLVKQKCCQIQCNSLSEHFGLDTRVELCFSAMSRCGLLL